MSILKVARMGHPALRARARPIEPGEIKSPRVQQLIDDLPQSNERLPLKERCTEALALSEEAGADAEMIRKRAQLQIAMTSVENLIQKTFLGG